MKGSLLLSTILVTVLYVVDLKSIHVCPVNLQTSTKLVDFWKRLICLESNNLTDLKQDLLSSVFYQDTVIIVHKGEWSIVNKICRKFSSSNISFITLNMANEIFNFTNFCSLWQTVLVFDATNETNRFLAKQSVLKTCAITTSVSINKFFSKLVDSCPLNILVTGDIECEITMNSFALKLYNKYNNTSNNSKEMVKDRIKVGAFQAIPFSNISKVNDTVYGQGIVFEILDRIVKISGIKYTVVLSPDNKIGIYNNGSWDGLIGMLLRKEIDLIVGSLTMNFERSQVVSFSPPFYFESMGILIKKPKLAPRLWRAFTLFDFTLWLLILIVALITILLLYGLHVCAAMPTDSPLERFVDCVWYVVASLSNQAYETNPRSWSAQNYLAFWWLYIIAIIAIYSGVLISLLTNKTSQLPFNSLKELVREIQKGEYKVCIIGSTSFHGMLLVSEEPDFVLLRKWLQNNPKYVAYNAGCIDLMLNGHNVAYIDEVSHLEELQLTFCEASLIILNDRFYPGWFSFAYRKNFWLNTQMKAIHEITESGLIDSWRWKYSNKTKPCRIITPETIDKDDSSDQGLFVDPLTLDEIGGSFVLLIAGILVAIVMFLVELFDVHTKKLSFTKGDDPTPVVSYQSSKEMRLKKKLFKINEAQY